MYKITFSGTDIGHYWSHKWKQKHTKIANRKKKNIYESSIFYEMIFSFTTENFLYRKSHKHENQKNEYFKCARNKKSMSNSTFQDKFAAP